MTASEISLVVGLLFAFAHSLGVRTCLALLHLAPIVIHILCAAVLGTTLAVTVFVADQWFGAAIPFWPAASMFYGGVIAWLYAFSAVYKSISLELLLALHKAPTGGMMLDELARDVVLPRFVERVEALVAEGLVKQADDGFAITAKGHEGVRRLRLIQRIFAVSGEGFYLNS